MGSLQLVTAPAVRPVSAADLKNYSRIDNCDDDGMLNLMLDAAIRLIEEYTNRRLITQTWDYWLDCFPHSNKDLWWDGVREGSISQLYGQAKDIIIPNAPISSVTFFKTFDNDDAEYTFASANYYVDTARAYGRVTLRLDSTWPATVLRTANGIQIRHVVGYGASGSSVPAPLRQAILETAGFIYQNRGTQNAVIPQIALQLIEPFRVMRL